MAGGQLLALVHFAVYRFRSFGTCRWGRRRGREANSSAVFTDQRMRAVWAVVVLPASAPEGVSANMHTVPLPAPGWAGAPALPP